MSIIRFRPEVADDLRDAFDWYDAKTTGLGDEFLGEYWSAIERIMNQPPAYGVGHTGLRACRLSRFPYVIHYRFLNREFPLHTIVGSRGYRNNEKWLKSGQFCKNSKCLTMIIRPTPR